MCPGEWRRVGKNVQSCDPGSLDKWKGQSCILFGSAFWFQWGSISGNVVETNGKQETLLDICGKQFMVLETYEMQEIFFAKS